MDGMCAALAVGKGIFTYDSTLNLRILKVCQVNLQFPLLSLRCSNFSNRSIVVAADDSLVSWGASPTYGELVSVLLTVVFIYTSTSVFIHQTSFKELLTILETSSESLFNLQGSPPLSSSINYVHN